ncbi:MAG: hypothetical protein QOG15_1172 [Solirubrobacteraceae bacterium]|nr:hypothetical protein [Solirubrobacteraceae bacterium]
MASRTISSDRYGIAPNPGTLSKGASVWPRCRHTRGADPTPALYASPPK